MTAQLFGYRNYSRCPAILFAQFLICRATLGTHGDQELELFLVHGLLTYVHVGAICLMPHINNSSQEEATDGVFQGRPQNQL